MDDDIEQLRKDRDFLKGRVALGEYIPDRDRLELAQIEKQIARLEEQNTDA